MKKLTLAFAALVATAFSVPAFADSSANATAGASAGADANSGGNRMYMAAGVSGAYCADSLVLGPIGGSATNKKCLAANIVKDAGLLATLSQAEIRAVHLALLSELGYTLVTVPTHPVETASANPRDAAATNPAASKKLSWKEHYATLPVLPMEPAQMNRKQKQAFATCKVVARMSSGQLVANKGCQQQYEGS